MKIELSKQQQIKAATLSEKRTVKSAVVSASSMGNSGSSDKSQLFASHLEKLISSLKSPGLMNIQSLRKSLPPLHSLLQILANNTFEPHDSDFLLMQKFVNSWLNKYGDFLPHKQKRDLVELSNLLRSNHLEVKDDESSRILYSLTSGEESGLPKWKIDYSDEGKSGSPEENDSPSCVFDLQLEHLGDIRTIVTEQKNGRSCCFMTARRDTAKLIRDSLQDFNKKLKERGVVLHQIKVLRKSKSDSDRKSDFKKRLDLWG